MKKLLECLLTLVLFLSVSPCVKAEENVETQTENKEAETTSKSLEDIVDEDGVIDEDATIVLDKDYEFDSLVITQGHTVTVDLNDKELLITGEEEALYVEGSLIIKDSTATESPEVEDLDVTYASGKIAGDVVAQDGGSITLESGTIEGNLVGLVAEGNTEGDSEIKSTVTVNGGYVLNETGHYAVQAYGTGAKLTINGGVFKAEDSAVVGGDGEVSGTTIEITDGKFVSVISEEAFENKYISCGVYQSQDGVLKITGGRFYIYHGVGVLVRGGTATISGDVDIDLTRHEAQPYGYVDNTDTVVPCAAVYKDSSKASISISGGYYSTDVSKYLANGYKALWITKASEAYDELEISKEAVISDSVNEQKVDESELAIDNLPATNIKVYEEWYENKEHPFDQNNTYYIAHDVAPVDGDNAYPVKNPNYETDGEKYKFVQFGEYWESSNEKVELEKALQAQNDVSEVIPLGISMEAIDIYGNMAFIQELSQVVSFKLFLNNELLSKVKDKKFTLYSIHQETDGSYSVTPVTEEKTTVIGNAISFKTDKFSAYALVTYNEVTPTPTITPTATPSATPTATAETKKSSSKSTSGWDDGGPFTTDSCGNVFDRWGNKIYEANGCNVGGYNLVRTSVKD